jgi:hypothetical protein
VQFGNIFFGILFSRRLLPSGPEGMPCLSWRPLVSVLCRRNSCTAPDRSYAPVATATLPRDSRCHCMPDILARSDWWGAFAFEPLVSVASSFISSSGLGESCSDTKNGPSTGASWGHSPDAGADLASDSHHQAAPATLVPINRLASSQGRAAPWCLPNLAGGCPSSSTLPPGRCLAAPAIRQTTPVAGELKCGRIRSI